MRSSAIGLAISLLLGPALYIAARESDPAPSAARAGGADALMIGSQGLAGVIWWEWTGSEGGPSDFGYTPKNKPAEKLLREWFAKGRSTAAAGAPSAQP